MTEPKKTARRIALAAVALGLAVGLIRLGMDAPAPPETESTNASSSTGTTTAVVHTSAGSSSPTSPTQTRTLSPAWIEAQTRAAEPEKPWTADRQGLAEAAEDLNYFRTNPNDWSTPMGALCWANHELRRTLDMRRARWELDYRLIPHALSIAGIDPEQLLPQPAETYWGQFGPAATEAALEALTRATQRPPADTSPEITDSTALFASGYVRMIDVEFIRLHHEYAGNGTEWLDAIDTAAGTSWNNAARTENDLPAAVRVYADALAHLAWEQATNFAPYLTHRMLGTLPGYDDFIQAAKYGPNCKRAGLAETDRRNPPNDPSWANVETTTTTTFPAGPVPVEGAELNGILTPAQSNISIGYFAKSGIGQLTDTTFTYQNTAYRIEQIYWRPNNTLRVDIHPDGLNDILPDNTELTIEPLSNPGPVFTATASNAWHLPPYIDFIWDTPLELEAGQTYQIELRINP